MIKKPEQFVALNYGEPVLLLGSCFSSAIGERLKTGGFPCMVNPLGVVFHPLALAAQIKNAINEDVSGTLFQLSDVWLHSLASSEVYGIGEKALLDNYSKQLFLLRQELKTASLLIVTLGSMHGYRLKETGAIVANCHKQPSILFSKECSEIDEVVEEWKGVLALLKEFNPQLNVVFTVSPVRYTRDGIIENTLSKARLVEVTHRLEANYFPSYELINDVLRDFSYFEEDQSHPNSRAVDAVWEVFRSWSFSAETAKIYEEVMKLRAREQHRFLFPDSQETKVFQTVTNEKREQLRSLYPYVVL